MIGWEKLVISVILWLSFGIIGRDIGVVDRLRILFYDAAIHIIGRRTEINSNHKNSLVFRLTYIWIKRRVWTDPSLVLYVHKPKPSKRKNLVTLLNPNPVFLEEYPKFKFFSSRFKPNTGHRLGTYSISPSRIITRY